MTSPTPPDPVVVWFDESGRLMSELGEVDNACFDRCRVVTVPAESVCGARPGAGTTAVVRRTDVGARRRSGIYLETHAKQLEADLISITVDHVGSDGPGSWRYRLLPMRWKTEGGWRDTQARLAVWPD